MTIRSGGNSEGIYLKYRHLPIGTQFYLEQIIKNLLWEKNKANEVMKILNDV